MRDERWSFPDLQLLVICVLLTVAVSLVDKRIDQLDPRPSRSWLLDRTPTIEERLAKVEAWQAQFETTRVIRAVDPYDLRVHTAVVSMEATRTSTFRYGGEIPHAHR